MVVDKRNVVSFMANELANEDELGHRWS